MNAHLKRGEIVELRPLTDILATLDTESALDGMPFMPEMLQYAGRRFTVTHRVEKICDTASGNWDPPRSRRMYDTVFLDDLRCDGSAHGGCQAGCRIYWKESWLRRADMDKPPASDPDVARASDPDGDRVRLEDLAVAGGRAVRNHRGGPAELYRCQATEAIKATEPLRAFDPRQYFRELASGNVGWLRFVRVSLPASISLISLTLRLPGIARRLRPIAMRGRPRPPRPRPAKLDLQRGELVEVRPLKEIRQSLDDHGKSRGLWYDPPEMGPFSGGHYRVKDRVERIIDEHTGEMIFITSDCLILEGVVCSGDHSTCRWFCPRGIYPYWREEWLRRVDEPNMLPHSAVGPADQQSES
jgi:hypothetical protein